MKGEISMRFSRRLQDGSLVYFCLLDCQSSALSHFSTACDGYVSHTSGGMAVETRWSGLQARGIRMGTGAQGLILA